MFLAGDHPSLAPSTDPAVAMAYLDRLHSDDPDVLARAAMVRAMAAAMEHVSRRSHPGVHLTASALVIDQARERVLALLHPKFGRWLQPGGHCDGDTNLGGVALREATEESGIDGLTIDPGPVLVSLHTGEPGPSAHIHADTVFVVLAPPGLSDVVPVSPEGHLLRWFGAVEIDELGDTPGGSSEVADLLRLGLAYARLPR